VTNDQLLKNIRRYGRAMKQCGRCAQQARFTTDPALKLRKQLQSWFTLLRMGRTYEEASSQFAGVSHSPTH
jgi:hypothetical protein